jgi:tetratricopeptide (TPR) repeat protein
VEGRQRLEILAPQAVTKADLIELIDKDPQLTPASRKAALTLADQMKDDPARLNRATWSVVKHADRKPEEYQSALKRAELLVQLADDRPDYHNTLGAANYRVGRYKEALASLERAEQGHKTLARPAPLAVADDHVFMAMAHHQLGNRTEALRFLKLAKEAKADTGGSLAAELKLHLAEAEALILGPR